MSEAAAVPVLEDLLAEFRQVLAAVDPVPGPVTAAARSVFREHRPPRRR